jgi:hypothetical protein
MLQRRERREVPQAEVVHPHSITSSARNMIARGTVRSAFPVLRWTASLKSAALLEEQIGGLGGPVPKRLRHTPLFE